MSNFFLMYIICEDREKVHIYLETLSFLFKLTLSKILHICRKLVDYLASTEEEYFAEPVFGIVYGRLKATFCFKKKSVLI